MKKATLLLLLLVGCISCARFQKVFGQAALTYNGGVLKFCQEDYEKKLKGCAYLSTDGTVVCYEVLVQRQGTDEWVSVNKQCVEQPAEGAEQL